jgi:hypothetical protein
MLNVDEILSALLAGKNVAADVATLRERFEIELEDVAGGYTVEQLEEDGEDADLIAEIQNLNFVVTCLEDAEGELARGDQAGAIESLRRLPGSAP